LQLALLIRVKWKEHRQPHGREEWPVIPNRRFTGPEFQCGLFDSIIVSQWFGCFPGAALAMRPNGSVVPLSRVKIGDTILTYDLSKHDIQPTTVVSFLHRDEHQFSTWIRITFASGLLLTANHLIYRRLSRNTETADVTSVFAKEIVPGDFILCSTTPREAFCEVLKVTEENGTLTGGSIGVYAPLTSSGTMLVDGVLVSCYAHVRYEWLARLATFPLRIYYFLVSQMNLLQPSWPVEHGVHWFAELLLHYAKFILPGTIFFN
uniref:HintN domain-containing protein n=1 Tax=Schistocephalus solidus TaxID=70667 RepID=A0A183TS98_SCHSO